MDWNRRLLSDAELRPFSDGPFDGLPARLSALMKQQESAWPMLRLAMEAIGELQYRELDVRGSRVLAQHNPGRIISTAAKVDAASISRRPCFLCADNLPAEEKGLEFGAGYVVLCNPFPVLKVHLVVSARDHSPQAISGRFGDFLNLADALGPDYFTLYNGPACGASAPDHHHFQACSREGVPLFEELENWPRMNVVESDDVIVFSPRDYRVNVLIARGKKKGRIETWFADALNELAGGSGTALEPMINLIATHDRTEWTVYLFPRSRHRPSCYFAEGQSKLTISPAGIDLASVLVVPESGHFARLTPEAVSRIYSEVTLQV